MQTVPPASHAQGFALQRELLPESFLSFSYLCFGGQTVSACSICSPSKVGDKPTWDNNSYYEHYGVYHGVAHCVAFYLRLLNHVIKGVMIDCHPTCKAPAAANAHKAPTPPKPTINNISSNVFIIP